MASPHASSFICLPYADNTDVVTAHTVYFAVCICTALVGAGGAILFMVQLTRRSANNSSTLGGSSSQRTILILLAISDLFADVVVHTGPLRKFIRQRKEWFQEGVVVRSFYWLVYWRPQHLDDEHGNFGDDLPSAIGATVIEHWVFFWYTATYFWTLFFSVDVYNAKHGGKWKLTCSHFFTWLFCFIYVTGSVCSLWTCPPYFNCAENSMCIISHFMCTLGPLLIILTAVPIFYISTWRQMKRNANMPSNVSVADIWRKEKELSRRKILSIILVFYLCWTVNIIDGLFLIVAHSIDPGPGHVRSILYQFIYDPKYIYFVWLLEGILNPLQGLLNAVAYGGLITIFWTWACNKYRARENPYVSSWSGEYIDVDFRVNKGKIHNTKRRRSI